MAIVNENKHGDKAIYAYVVSKKIISVTNIKYVLKKELPDYMIPSFIYQLERIPFTSSGKVDKRALSKLEIEDETSYIEPANEIERMICDIFSKILDIRKVGADDDFFMLGGHSFLAIRLSIELQQQGYEFSLKDIFSYSRVRDIARLISGEEVNTENKQETKLDLIANSSCDSIKKQLIWEENKVYIYVEPYNDLFFKSCFYNALFACIKYFGINPFDIMVHSFPSYEVDKNKGLIGEKFIERKSWREILEEDGLEVTTFTHCDSIIETVRTSLRKNALIIIQLDGFYSPIRPDLFGKIHWAHNILICGYDNLLGEFSVLEQSDRNLLDYKEKKISFYDLEIAFMEGCKRFEVNPSEPPIVIINEKSMNKEIITRNGGVQNRNELVDNIIYMYPIYEKSLSVFQNGLYKYFDSLMKEKDDMSLLLDNINKIIESKKVFKRLLIDLFIDEKIHKEGAVLLELWEILRTKLVRVSFSNRKRSIDISGLKTQVISIISSERKIMNLICHSKDVAIY